MEITSPEKCCGCSACHAICPVGAITMSADSEGFLHPVIDGNKCIKCNRCKAVCPVLHRGVSRQPLAVYAAKAKDDALRMDSSSGGMFSLLARNVFLKNGIVFGAGWDHATWRVIHKTAENENELSDLRGSKYVQSDVRGIYRRVKEELEKGREVLFSGTPCQIAAIRLYLGKSYDNLILVDVVCHGVPSPLAWQKYLEERVRHQFPARQAREPIGSLIMRISSRRKNCGWKRYSLSLRFANDNEYLQDLYHDTFLRGFLSELFNRPSCHDCQCRELRSGSDLTIADYWGVHEKFPEIDDDKGTSLVLVNTFKAEDIWSAIQDQVSLKESDFEDAVRTNPSIMKSVQVNPKRDKFFKQLSRKGFDKTLNRLLSRPLWRRAGSFVKRIIRRFI